MTRRDRLIAAAIASLLCAGCASKPRCDCCLGAPTQSYSTSYGSTR